MSDRLPPLTALRAFDAAARHLSFAKAADELSVTPAALSFQIKNLEEHLGQPLFRRLNRAVELTEAGRVLAPGARDGFDRLAEAWRSTKRLQDTRGLSVTAGPAFTAKWLAPRLYAFAQTHPDIELRFAATLRQLDLDRDEIDVAIRYGLGDDSGLQSEKLMSEAIMPMMSPALADRFQTPESLITAPLFHDGSMDFLDPAPGWHHWFKACGIDTSVTPAARFSQADHALDAALAGGGVVLTRSSLASHYLADGRLVAPFPVALTTPARFRLITAPAAIDRPQVRAFHNWLKAEVARYPDPLKDRELIPIASL